jgi:O-methyltransferase
MTALKQMGKRMVRWLATSDRTEAVRQPFLNFVSYGLMQRNQVIVSFKEPERARGLALIQQIRRERNLLLRINEAYQIYSGVRCVSHLDGDLAEVGVFQGGSAKLICEAKRNKPLHLFDTFAGLPEPGKHDPKFSAGQFAASMEDVQAYLRSYPNVHFYKGLFPATAGPVHDRRFCFVNIDVDLYEGTRCALEFFYPRLTLGGILISHDYLAAEGVYRAFHEYFDDKGIPIIEVTDTQCMVVKTASI